MVLAKKKRVKNSNMQRELLFEVEKPVEKMNKAGRN